jgi:hypothetical protein
MPKGILLEVLSGNDSDTGTKTLRQATILHAPTKTSYLPGEAIDLEGL